MVFDICLDFFAYSPLSHTSYIEMCSITFAQKQGQQLLYPQTGFPLADK